jgi:hypothetical protein
MLHQPWVIVLLTLAAAVVVKLLVLLALGRGSLARLGLAWQAFSRILGDPAVAAKVQPLLVPALPEPKKPPKLSGEPVRLLALLQREGRLLDFLLEDVSGAADEQLGAGVREIHRKAQQVIQEHLTLEPVLSQPDGAQVEVPPGFDPSAIRLTGNVTGQPPFKGTLQHHGWRVKGYNIPTPPAGQDDLVLMPAEVELP